MTKIQPAVMYQCDRCKTSQVPTQSLYSGDEGLPTGWRQLSVIGGKTTVASKYDLCPTCYGLVMAVISEPKKKKP